MIDAKLSFKGCLDDVREKAAMARDDDAIGGPPAYRRVGEIHLAIRGFRLSGSTEQCDEAEKGELCIPVDRAESLQRIEASIR